MVTAQSLLAAYLLATLPSLLLTGADGGAWAIAVAHVAVCVGLLKRPRRGTDTMDFWAWAPLLAVPLLYAEIPLLNQWSGQGYHDDVVQVWDAALFGGQPSVLWSTTAPWLWLSEPLHAAYLTYYPLIYLPFAILYRARRSEDFHGGARVVMGTFLTCYVGFILFPVQGPRYLLSPPDALPVGPMRGLSLLVLETGSSRGAAFPSAHVALATAQALLAHRAFGPFWGRALGVIALALAAGAVYGGFHYVSDVVAGGVVGALAFWIGGRVQPPSTTQASSNTPVVPVEGEA